MTPSDQDTRAGFVALAGASNVGKSTLLNRLVGTKVSIVSPKVQTTRTRVLGIALHGATQVVFVDTPGMFTPRRRLDRAMVASAWSGMADADHVVVVVDARRGLDDDTRALLTNLAETDRPAVVALNKIDLVTRPALLPLAAAVAALHPGISDTFMISATEGDGVDALMDRLAAMVPAGPWLFPEDQVSDMPLRLLAAEITREKLFLRLHQELPYAIAVETETWTEQDDGAVRVNQVIYVQRDNQKAIVLGRQGRQIKAIGADARQELEEILERRVHLFLFVKVRENWGNDPERYREWGLDYHA